MPNKELTHPDTSCSPSAGSTTRKEVQGGRLCGWIQLSYQASLFREAAQA